MWHPEDPPLFWKLKKHVGSGIFHVVRVKGGYTGCPGEEFGM
jgi:hypothetical protein